MTNTEIQYTDEVWSKTADKVLENSLAEFRDRWPDATINSYNLRPVRSLDIEDDGNTYKLTISATVIHD